VFRRTAVFTLSTLLLLAPASALADRDRSDRQARKERKDWSKERRKASKQREKDRREAERELRKEQRDRRDGNNWPSWPR
jgi:hypothetical protein